ncbi:MAG: phage holin family protein [Chloroflexota bacterium]
MEQRSFLFHLIINMFTLAVTAYIVPAITPPDTFLGLVWAAFVFGIVNAIIRPILTVLSLPFIVVTLGLFIFILNALLLQFVGALTGLTVAGFGGALLGAIVIALVNMVLSGVFRESSSAKA